MAVGRYSSTLRLPGLQALLWTQFLGAFNGNVGRVIIGFTAVRTLGAAVGIPLSIAVVVAPFLLFAGWSGHLADRRSRRRVIVQCKVVEIVAALLAIPALTSGRLDWQLGVLFLRGLVSTFASPAKHGIVTQIVPAEDLSRANGLLQASTFAAIAVGATVGGALLLRWHAEPMLIGIILVATAIAGTVSSLAIHPVPATAPGLRFALNPIPAMGLGITRLVADPTLRMTAVGISYFWFVGALLQQMVIPWWQESFAVEASAATQLFSFVVIGSGLGSLTAGRLSGDKIELGLVPVGAVGLGVFTLLLGPMTASYGLAVAGLVVLGFSGGLFIVPLYSLLQQRPDDGETGRVIAVSNVLTALGVLLSVGVVWVLEQALGLTSGQVILVCGLFTLVATIYAVATLPEFLARFALWLLTHTLYRVRIVGQPHIPLHGPALIIANHVSMIDGALVGACIQRFVRFIVSSPIYHSRRVHWLFRRIHAIPVSAGNRREVVDAIARARAELVAGHVVCIFAEGAVSRTGNLLPFKRGFERMIRGLDVPIVPVYLDRVWGSIFSFKGQRFIWKRPERLPYPVTLNWGQPMASSSTASDVRQRLAELGADAMAERRPGNDRLHLEFVRAARRHKTKFAMADTTGQSLTFGRALLASFALSRVITRRTPGQENVATLLPASVGGALANIAISMAGKVPVNLNFTIGPEPMAGAIAQAEIRTIVTSRVFIAKAELAETPEMVFLEDLRKEISTVDKMRSLVDSRFTPVALLRRRFARESGTRPASIIFSSGSTGVPKGVVLTHANVLANVDSLAQIFPVGPGDCFIGVLPFFHSFGFTGTMWFPLLQGAGVAYHPNPTDAKTIGELAETHKATMLISTPTFCSSYVRRCTKEQFAHLKYAIVGAEKLREPLATEFLEKYGIGLLEGYGCTEMAPVVAVNRPDVHHGTVRQTGTKAGSVGHPIPGVAAKVVDRESGVELGIGEEGLLLVRGPNMMAGYLGAPERTAEVVRDGWYVTGDIAKIDEDGFIFITDRLSRFSKIGGEMVPHMRIEDAINAVLVVPGCIVTAVPDVVKGERLVAFYTRQDMSAEELWARLGETALPRLWIPRRDCLIQIDAIPTLGTGKVDLRRVKQLAIDVSGRAADPSSVTPA